MENLEKQMIDMVSSLNDEVESNAPESNLTGTSVRPLEFGTDGMVLWVKFLDEVVWNSEETSDPHDAIETIWNGIQARLACGHRLVDAFKNKFNIYQQPSLYMDATR
jgi:hypothetical protein